MLCSVVFLCIALCLFNDFFNYLRSIEPNRTMPIVDRRICSKDVEGSDGGLCKVHPSVRRETLRKTTNVTHDNQSPATNSNPALPNEKQACQQGDLHVDLTPRPSNALQTALRLSFSYQLSHRTVAPVNCVKLKNWCILHSGELTSFPSVTTRHEVTRFMLTFI
jgi:hypothetical protein